MAFHCSCRYCLCFFSVNVLLDFAMLILLVCTYVFFGNMPPFIQMSIGFWLLFYTNFLGMYMTLIAGSTFSRHQDIQWINKMTRVGILACAIGFFLGGILFLIPGSAAGMLSFSKAYYSLYGSIPPFLDTMQKKYTCCGIYNYLDYGRPDFTDSSYNETGFLVSSDADPDENEDFDLIVSATENRTGPRRTTGLDVPQSCCVSSKAKDPEEKDCGKEVEYTGAPKGTLLYFYQDRAARTKINDPTMGCYLKYENIQKSGSFQLTYLIGCLQVMSLVQCALHLALLWFHSVGLKTIRQLNYWLPELLRLHEDTQMATAELEAQNQDETKSKLSKAEHSGTEKFTDSEA